MNNKQQHNFFLTLTLCLLILGTFISLTLLGSVPPVSRDALTHHLAVPKLYLEHGGIYEIPELNFSYYPMNLDLLYMVPLYFGNDILPKFIHFIFGLLTAGIIYQYLTKKIDKLHGLLSALFFLTIPIIIKLSITVYVDLGLIFFTTAAMLLLFKWMEENYQYRYLILAGICCGLAMGTKYNGLLSLLLLSCCVPILFVRSATSPHHRNIAAIRYGLLFTATAIIIASPWLIRNTLWTGNPLFPLFDNFFNPAHHQTISRGIDIFTTRRIIFHETPLQIISLPLRIFFEGQDNNPQYFDGKLNPFLLILPIFSFIRLRQKSAVLLEQRIMLAFSILFLLLAFFQTGMRIRYITPIIPFLVILSIFGLHNLHAWTKAHFQAYPDLAKSLPILCILAMLSYNIIYLAKQFNYVQPLAFISGNVSRDNYISKYVHEYPVVQYANKQKNSPHKTLCLFLGNRGYYMDFPHTFDVPMNKKSPFTQLITTSANAETISWHLLNKGYTQILLRNDLTKFWIDNLKKHKDIAAFFFQHHTRLLYTQNGYSLFSILPDQRLQQTKQ